MATPITITLPQDFNENGKYFKVYYFTPIFKSDWSSIGTYRIQINHKIINFNIHGTYADGYIVKVNNGKIEAYPCIEWDYYEGLGEDSIDEITYFIEEETNTGRIYYPLGFNYLFGKDKQFEIPDYFYSEAEAKRFARYLCQLYPVREE